MQNTITISLFIREIYASKVCVRLWDTLYFKASPSCMLNRLASRYFLHRNSTLILKALEMKCSKCREGNTIHFPVLRTSHREGVLHS
jgi:hypothetical protein